MRAAICFRADASVDLQEAICAGEDGDESMSEVFDGCMLDRFLLDMDVLGDGLKEL